jgi:peptidyl-prolyl cis-trans isomerase SurA
MKLANIVFSAIALVLFSEMPLAQNKNKSIDEVIAIVDTSLVTKLELENRVALIEKQFKAANRPLPPANDLKAQVLERLISERIQQNLAKEAGIKVSDRDLDRILGNIAAQSKLSVPELKIKIEKEGTNFNKYKEEIRKEVQAARLRAREVDARVQVSESEIDSYISEKNRGKVLQAGNDEIYLVQLLIGLPTNASESDVAAAKNKAEDVLKQASVEKDFLAYGKKIALPGSGVRVEDLGYRTLDRLPQLFVDGAQGIGSNQMIPRVLQSGAGFHVIKVIDRKGTLAANVQNIVVTQTQARHILLRHRPGVTDLEAQRRLNGFKDQMKVKASDFAQLAKKHSEDGSAPNGGNLGWMSPGELVPEFEQAMNQLNINEVSDPVRTEFGWHLIQVVERRQAQLSADKQRDYARAAIREKKLDQAYQDWLRQIRDAATVEIRQSN